MTHAGPRARRRVKFHAGHLGPLLCWSVVFADIGTSIYYVPGILHSLFGTRAAVFVVMVLAVFVLLCLKYAEVAWRYPEGGGVVTVASRALHPFAGLLGGLLILVDYYLTVGISALSGVYYLGVLVPVLSRPLEATLVTVAALLALGALNVVGIRESARASAVFAGLALVGQLLVIGAVLAHLGPAAFAEGWSRLRSSPVALTPAVLVTGYGAAFLAFSGLESVAQISPAMRSPRRQVSFRTMALVVLTIGITSPLLTLWTTTLQPLNAVTEQQSVSLLGAHFGGLAVGDFVAVSGALLLIFASNTAVIGAYHVFLALTRMGFLPRIVETRNRRRHTPHIAIALAIGIPIGVVVFAQGSINLLGDLYAFGLLGAFVLTCLALDVVRWPEPRRGLLGWAGFALGVLTTVAVAAAWSINLVQKPLATRFGGAITVLGLAVGLATYWRGRRRRPAVFPLPYLPSQATESVRREFLRHPAEVLVILPRSPEMADAVLQEAAERAAGRSAVVLYRSDLEVPAPEGMLEVRDPYLRDYVAQDALARAETRLRKAVPDRRFVYVPSSLPREVLGRVWAQLDPRETIAEQQDGALLPGIALSRVKLRVIDGVAVAHLVSGRLHVAAI